jgi:putative glutathione S-transferase
MNAWTYPDLNNGVYRAGFATAQDAYNDAVTAVFGALDRLEDHLATHPGPYLFGETITDADVRVYTTLVRFDVAYFTIFKCNLKMVRYEYPKLHAWLRGLYWDQDERVGRAFRGTVDFDAVSERDMVRRGFANLWMQYKKGYTNAVRGQVVPIGPEVGVLPL